MVKDKDRNKFLKRQTSLLIGLSLSTLFIFMAISLYNNVTASRYQQVDMWVEALLDEPTQVAGDLLVQRESKDRDVRISSKKQLKQLVDDISANEYVTSLHVFAENGKLLNSSQDDYVAQLVANKQYAAPENVRVYLRPLLANDLLKDAIALEKSGLESRSLEKRVLENSVLVNSKPVGFLQLHFRYQDMLNTTSIFQFNTAKSISLLLLLLSMLAVVIGVSANRIHHKFRLKG